MGYENDLWRRGFKHVRKNIWRTKTHEARVIDGKVAYALRPYWWTMAKLQWRCRIGWKLEWWYIKSRLKSLKS